MTATMTPETFTRFDVPEDLAATEPAEVRGSGRDDVRMLVAGFSGLSPKHFRDLPEDLRPGYLSVVSHISPAKL